MSTFKLPGIALALVATLAVSAFAHAAPTLDDYRHFRALSIDLLGRMPTREELAGFEKPAFQLDAWIDQQLKGPGYAQRMTRIYMDLLRLEVGPAVQFAPPSATLKRQQITGPDGKPMFVYFRTGQRRSRDVTDGEFCLSEAEVGFQLQGNNQIKGTPKAVTQAALDEHTALVRPWWLYRDYLSGHPTLRYKQGWTDPDPLFQPIDELQSNPDKSPTEEIRVCKEEAQTVDTGTIHASNRPPLPKGSPPQLGRLRPLPGDDGYARQHAGEPLSCRSSLALGMTVDCGCGLGLQYCMPGDSTNNDPRAFAFPGRTFSGMSLDQGFALGPQSVSTWSKMWWSEEAKRFFGYLFDADRDFRELLSARWSFVNGPLAHFYKASAPASCCNREKAFNMVQETEPLFDPRNLPADLFPSDVHTWKLVPDRGPHASGILTMPVFLTKYASRRARGAVLYTAFLCKSFVAENLELTPSKEPNLMLRPGCSTCHATLEPLAAYFARVEETEWVYLPEWQFPTRNFNCKANAQGKIPGYCEAFYDPAFSDTTSAMLRGAHASVDHAASGPVGAASYITGAPEFARCAVERVASSFLGRPVSDDDAALVSSLEKEFAAGGYHMRPLVRALVKSDAYLKANNDRWPGGPPGDATPVSTATAGSAK